MKRILLIGGCGFIGKNLHEQLVAEGNFVARTDLIKDVDDIYSYVLPILDIKSTLELINNLSINVVIHLSSSLIPASPFAEFKREIEQNIKPTFELIDYCATHGIQFLYFSSGGAIYGDAGTDRIAESHPRNPKNIYGYSKLLIEEFVEYAHRSNGLQYIIIRPSNPYGKHQRIEGAQGFIGVSIGKIKKDLPLVVWGDGTVVRDYVDVTDLAFAVAAIIRSGIVNKTFNVGNGVGYNLNQVIDMLRDATGKSVEVVYEASRAVDTKSIILDCKSLSQTIAWRPRDLFAGLRDFLSDVNGKN